MKYILLIYRDENAPGEKTSEECARATPRLIEDLTAKGQYLAAAPLHPTSTATSLRVRNGKQTVTDGPFAETHEQLGGYYLIDTASLDEAIDIAGRVLGTRTGTIEIRPVADLPLLSAEGESNCKG
jgi:hypothetical protein